MSIAEKMVAIQSKLNAPKNQYNSFGKYNYRSCESILEAVKPLLKEQNCFMVITDDIFNVGDRVYVQAVATITDVESGETVQNTAFAREAEKKTGMDDSQITGTASSYARKYALNGLFLIDDNKDADTDENHIERKARTEYRQSQDDPKVGAKQIEQVTELAGEKGVSITAICDRFQVVSLQDLTMKQFVQAVKMLEATKKKNEVA